MSATAHKYPIGRIVEFNSDSGTRLHGFLVEVPKPRAVVMHVHGSLGNFYANRFLAELGEDLRRFSIALLSVNLRTHDGISEAINDSSSAVEYVGGSIIDFDSCIEDISGVLKWTKREFAVPSILQGHSLGCDRVLRFLQVTRRSIPFSLLSPCDSKEIQLRWEAAISATGVSSDAPSLVLETAVNASFPMLLPELTYGVSGEGAQWKYPIPVSRVAFNSIMHGFPGTSLHLRVPCQVDPGDRIVNSGYIYIGAADEILTCSPEEMATRLRELVVDPDIDIVEGGRHDLSISGGTTVCSRVSSAIDRMVSAS